MAMLDMYRFNGLWIFKESDVTPERRIKGLNVYGLDIPKLMENLIWLHLYDTKTKFLLPKLFLKITHSEPEYDYDCDDNLQYTGQIETTNYLMLNCSPVNGKVFDPALLPPPERNINEDALIDLYSKRKELMTQSTKKRSGKKILKELDRINHEIHSILGDFPDVVIDDTLKTHKASDWFSEDDVIPMEQFIQMRLDEMEEK